MGKLFDQLKEQWKHIRGDAKFKTLEWLWANKNKVLVGWSMLIAFLTAAWDLLVSPLGPFLFINCLGAFAITLLIANKIQLRRIRTRWEQHQAAIFTSAIQHAEIEEAARTIAELQAKLSTLESTQPCLKTESYVVKRKAGFGQSGAHHFRDHVGYFILLRVTNEPTSLNSQARAHHIYATISYCDNQWSEFFPSVHGGWFSLWQSYGPQTIGPPKDIPDSLAPHESTYLGIALSYESDPQLRLYALDKSSGEWSNWFNPDLALPTEIIYIKVLVGCNGFQRTYSYILSHHGAHLSPLDPPH